MIVEFSQSFLTDIERIDNKVVIDRCLVVKDGFSRRYDPEIICHDGLVQVCISGLLVSECERLEFYYGGELAFSISSGSTIELDKNRTIFKFSLPANAKAELGCSKLTEDTEFLESAGTELGSSLYKNIKISDSSLIWKESLEKYTVDRGLQDNHYYDIELIDTKSGRLEDRPIRFKSYQNITLEQGNWKIATIKKTEMVKHDIYSKISDSAFFVWDSPMSDATVVITENPTCYENFDKYLDPDNIVFGNTDCFQFINYQSNLKGFRITGVKDSEVDILFNRESTSGPYTSFRCVIGESGVSEVMIPELSYYHLNGIITAGPSKITKIETITYIEESEDVYIPDPDKTYIVDINNTDCVIKVEGTCDYIEYEKYLGEIREIGRGTDHINSIPEIDIICLEGKDEDYLIDNLGKQIKCKYNSEMSGDIHYAVFQVIINNNTTVKSGTIIQTTLTSDYKIRIEQTGIIWKILDSPDYIYDDGLGIYLLDYKSGSTKVIRVGTNQVLTTELIESLIAVSDVSGYFEVSFSDPGREVLVDGETLYEMDITVKTLKTNHNLPENPNNTWIPQVNGEPYIIKIYIDSFIINSLSFYAIQLSKEASLEIWEETFPGQFSKVETGNITIFNSLTKNFIVVKRVEVSEDLNWYYYDLNTTNKFYITDLNQQITNTGLVFYVDPNTVGPIKLDRRTYGRTINVNRSDITGSLGILTITENQVYPGSWRDLIDSNTINIGVYREVTNIYIDVNGEDKDLELVVNSINLYSVTIKSNFKYVVNTYGYLKIYDSSVSEYPTEKYVLSGYNKEKTFTFVLTRLDEEDEMANSYVEIKSGSITRKITLKVVLNNVRHTWITEGAKPNLIRVYKNGTFTTEQTFNYKSTTTPEISYINVTKVSTSTEPVFSPEGYSNHNSKVNFNVPSLKKLTQSKYPMKSFGGISESSLSYSEIEVLDSDAESSISPIEYPFYMKGKRHFLWCVKSLNDFTSINDPTEEGSNYEKIFDISLDSSGESGQDIYVISRYGIDNKTFSTEAPKENRMVISRNDLEAVISISSQQKITLDEVSQIEYAIPINIKSNVQNNGGNIFLGSFSYKAVTEATEDTSLNEIIDISTDLAKSEGIIDDYGNIIPTYVNNYLIDEISETIKINIYQQGTDPLAHGLYSGLKDMGIMAETGYIIPEIGSDLILTEVTFNKVVTGNDNDIVTFDKYYSDGDNYFYIVAESEDRVNKDFWYSSIPSGIVNNTYYDTTTNFKYKTKISEGIHSEQININFTKYGCNYGLYVGGAQSGLEMGFGYIDPEIDWKGKGYYTTVNIPSDGGDVCIHAGIFYAIDDLWSTESLIVPTNYEFIGDNIPDKVLWEDGNLDDEGNLILTVPPRIREDYGDKEYILHVSQPHEYFPINLYVIFSQAPYYDSSNPDITQEDYKLTFLKTNINVFSNGSVEGDDKIYFTHNLNREIFDRVVFDWTPLSGTSIPKPPDDPDDLTELSEVERSYEEGYVKFYFKPNGSRIFITAQIVAKYKNSEGNYVTIGVTNVNMGYYCLTATYHNPFFEDKQLSSSSKTQENPLPRLAPRQVILYVDKYGNPTYVSDCPCYTNNDNSQASMITNYYSTSRGVFSLKVYRKEFYDSAEVVIDVQDVFREVDLIGMSPTSILDSYSVTYNNTKESYDRDAIMNKLYNTYNIDPYTGLGLKYITGTNFSDYTPYIEFNYTCKKEYIIDEVYLSELCKISIVELNTDKIATYYLSTCSIKLGSDQTGDIEDLKFSDYNLKFGCAGGKKQVVIDPAYFNKNKITLIGSNTSWVTVNYSGQSNFIGFTAASNMSADGAPAYYRTVQAQVDVFDPRDESPAQSRSALKAFYINIEQEPDAIVGSGSEEGGGGGKVPSNIYINVKIINSSGVEVPITGEMRMYVGGHNGIDINLPGASSSSTLLTLEASDETNFYSINCVGNGVDPSELLDQLIENSVVVYASSGNTHNSSYITAHITGNSSVFASNQNYEITITNYDPNPAGNVNVSMSLVNSRTGSDVDLCGLIMLQVLDTNLGTTVGIWANLPDASTSDNVYTVERSSTIGPFAVECTGTDADIHPENYIGGTIMTVLVYTYDNGNLRPDPDISRPYNIVNVEDPSDHTFKKDAQYQIEFGV